MFTSLTMFYILVMFFCSLVAFLVALDFYVKHFTTYKIAKSMQSPPMLPIIGSILFLCASQGEIKSEIEILPQFESCRNLRFELILFVLQKKRINSAWIYAKNSKMVLLTGHSGSLCTQFIQPIQLRWSIFWYDLYTNMRERKILPFKIFKVKE